MLYATRCTVLPLPTKIIVGLWVLHNKSKHTMWAVWVRLCDIGTGKTCRSERTTFASDLGAQGLLEALVRYQYCEGLGFGPLVITVTH